MTLPQIIRKAPVHMAISVETFTHEFAQSTIIARISPPRQPRNVSEPHTIIGAHQVGLLCAVPRPILT